MHSVHLISVERKTVLACGPRTVLGDEGWRGIGVSGSGYNEVLALEVRNVV